MASLELMVKVGLWVLMGFVLHAAFSAFINPRRQLRKIAAEQGWKTVERESEIEVYVPVDDDTVMVWSWERPVDGEESSKQVVKGWSTAASVNLPVDFLKAYADTVTDFLQGQATFDERRGVFGEVELLPDDQQLHFEPIFGRATLRGVTQAIELTRTMARRLDFGESDPNTAMRRLAQTSPTPLLAWTSLVWTLDNDPHHPMLPELLTAGLRAQHPEHRLVAARHVHDERALQSLLDLVSSGSWSHAIRIEGLTLLLKHPALLAQTPEQQLQTITPLLSLIPQVRDTLLHDLVTAIDQTYGAKIAILTLASRLGAVNTACRRVLVRAMDRHEEEAEPHLLAALKDDEPAVRTVALEVLARWGTPTALGPIRKVADNWLINPPEARAAQDALTAIEERYRLAIKSAGGLVLSDAPAGQGGQLSETTEGGALALEEPA